jgi:hypothetical protein
MNEIDKKIIEQLIPVLVSVHSVEFESDFCKDIGLLKQNLQRIKNGIAHFTPKHIQSICEKYNINSNWIFGLETNVYRLKTIPFHR